MAASSTNRQKIARATLSTRISEQLRDEILSGVFLVGAQLNEMQTARDFGVSRGPLREAIQRLIQEGLLRSEPNRGVFVPELFEEDLLDIFFVRTTLENSAAQRILLQGDRRKVSQALTDIANRMHLAVSAGNWHEGSELDFEFHRLLVDAACSERLSRSYATVQAETKMCLHKLMGGYRNTKKLAEEHFHLARLIGDASMEEILAALTEHLRDPTSAYRKARTALGETSGPRVRDRNS